MSAEEFTSLDERCASLLASVHDALLAGETPLQSTDAEVPPELRARLERDVACVQLLEQVWPPHPYPSPPGGENRGKRGVTGRLQTPTAPHHLPSSTWQGGEGGPNAVQLPLTIGRFQIRRELGRGGYGIVFLAYDPQLGREVALKVPRPEAVLTLSLRERFLREARAAAVLDHPTLVPVYDAGEVGPFCYIASAYCPGTTLDAWLKARVEPVPWQEAAALVATLAEAVHHAHAHGVVHRDLKPANILLVSNGAVSGKETRLDAAATTTHHAPLTTHQPKITDFGLAKFHSLDPGAATPEYLTLSGTIMGTPRYMAPEQAAGSSQAVGPAADIHALGAILYEVLTGRPPFVAETVLDILEQVRSHEPLPPSRLRPKLPRDLETICLRCLQKEPGRRYASAVELAEDLRRFLSGEPIRARPIPAWERIVKWARRRPAAAALLVVSSLASLLLVAGLAVGLLVISDKQHETQDALGREKKAREDLEQTSYLNGITSAEHEISLKNWSRAQELLEKCPVKLRGWEWCYLERLRHTPSIKPLPVGERISMSSGGFDLAFHPNGHLLAIPSGGNCIQIWDATNGRKVLILRGHKARVLSLSFSPDGGRLASASEDKTVKVWNVSALNAGLLEGELTEPVFTCDHQERVNGVAFSPDGQRLASASGETNKRGEVKVWEAASGKLLFPFPGQALPNAVVHLAFSPDGRRLASGSVDNTVKVWDLTTGQEIHSFSGHMEPILNVTFTPDGRRLISAGRDRVVNVWDLGVADQGELAPLRTLPKFSLSPWCMALSPDGTRLAIGGPTADGNVRVYDLTTGALLQILKGDIRVISVAFSPDGQRLASAGHDSIVRLWDTTTGQEVLSLRGHLDLVGRVLFSPDGQCLASASADGTVRVWDASHFDQNAAPGTLTLGGHDSEFFGLAFSADGRSLASASADNSIELWDTQTGHVVRTFRGHKDAVLCVAFSPDGRRLLSGSMDRTVKLWDTQTGEVLLGLDDFKVMVHSVAFCPDGHAFATGAHLRLQLWGAQTGQQLLARQADPEFVNCVTFNRDGKYVAAVGHTGTAKVWDVNSRNEVSTFPGHKTSVFCVAFHPTGDYLASGDSDFEVKLWKPSTPNGQLIGTLLGHKDYLQGVAFTPDGRYLATASWGEVIVWDVTSLDSIKKLQEFDRLAGRVTCIAFSPDGKRLAAATGYKGQGEIKIWDAILWENKP